MTYTANVPVSGQSLGSSRPIINANFGVIQTAFDANHVDFNLANAGSHTHVDLLEQGSDPNPAVDILSLYSKAVSGVTEWFMQRENSGAVIQMSNGTPVASTTGKTFLPGGLIMQFGTVGPLTGSISFVTVVYASPFPSNVFSITATTYNAYGIGTVGTTGFSTTGFRYYFQTPVTVAGGFYLYYMAIGN